MHAIHINWSERKEEVQGKLALHSDKAQFNQTYKRNCPSTRHEDIPGGGVDVQLPSFLSSAKTEVNGCLHNRPLYHQRKSRRYPVNKRMCGPQRWSGRFGGKKNLLRLPDHEPRLVQPVALVTILKTVSFCQHVPALNNSGLFQVLLL